MEGIAWDGLRMLKNLHKRKQGSRLRNAVQLKNYSGGMRLLVKPKMNAGSGVGLYFTMDMEN